MATAARFVGSIFMFLAGLVAGIALTIAGVGSHVELKTGLEALSPIFLFSYTSYVAGIGMMVGLSILLRKAADRIV